MGWIGQWWMRPAAGASAQGWNHLAPVQLPPPGRPTTGADREGIGVLSGGLRARGSAGVKGRICEVQHVWGRILNTKDVTPFRFPVRLPQASGPPPGGMGAASGMGAVCCDSRDAVPARAPIAVWEPRCESPHTDGEQRTNGRRPHEDEELTPRTTANHSPLTSRSIALFPDLRA